MRHAKAADARCTFNMSPDDWNVLKFQWLWRRAEIQATEARLRKHVRTCVRLQTMKPRMGDLKVHGFVFRVTCLLKVADTGMLAAMRVDTAADLHAARVALHHAPYCIGVRRLAAVDWLATVRAKNP